MKKMNYWELHEAMCKFNEENPNGKMYGVIVFTEDSFGASYTEKERSYRVSNDNKAFQHGKISNSLFGDCLDYKDLGVRLDVYMYDGWKVEYCYIEETK